MSSSSPNAPASKRATPDAIATAVDAFRRILREFRRAARKTELATGLSAAQSFVLNAVHDAPGCSLSDVAALTMTDRTSVAAIVERLVEDRYLTRERADADRRRTSLTITARGQRAIRDAAPPPTKLLVDALHALPAAERNTLARGLTALSRRMGVGDEPAGMLFEDGRTTYRPAKRR